MDHVGLSIFTSLDAFNYCKLLSDLYTCAEKWLECQQLKCDIEIGEK